MLIYTTPEDLRAEPDHRRFWLLGILTCLRDRADRLEVRFGDGDATLYHRVQGRDWELTPVSEELFETLKPTVRGFGLASARMFEKAESVGQMMGGNLVLRIAAAPTNKGGVRLRAGGIPMDLVPNAAPERFSFSTGGSQVAEFAATNGGVAPALREEGPWALFRVLDKGRKQTIGQAKYRFVFSPDSAIDIEVAGGPDPFAPDGPFALRCPVRL